MSRKTLIILVLVGGIVGSAFGVSDNNRGAVWPGRKWEQARPQEAGMDATILRKARDYALTGEGPGCVIRRGRCVMQWGDQTQRYDLKSTTKAIGITAVGLALKDGKINSLRDRAKKYHPSFSIKPESNIETGWLDKITLFDLATQTAGFDKNGGYTKLMFELADRMVMARVPKEQVLNRDAYEFFKGLSQNSKCHSERSEESLIWTKDIHDRGAVFINPGRCYRSGISYNAGLKRYLWCQTIYGKDDMRFKGGLGIFDAPEPWGPWTTVFYTEQWDVGPGETSSLPTKWMSSDGKTCYLLFSGDDCFSVRKAVFNINNN